MNLRWFYVSLICLFVVLFNHTVLPIAVPTRIVGTPRYWMVVVAVDAVAFIAALVTVLMSLFLKSPSKPEAGDATTATGGETQRSPR